MADANQYRQMIDEDFQVAPLTPAQQGQMAGEASYNEMVPFVNQLTTTGEPLRRMYSPETELRMKADEDAYNAFQAQQQGRAPQSERSAASQLLRPDIVQSLPVQNYRSDYVTDPSRQPPPPQSYAGSMSVRTSGPAKKQPSTQPTNPSIDELRESSDLTTKTADLGTQNFADIARKTIEATAAAEQDIGLTQAEVAETERMGVENRIQDQRRIQLDALQAAEEQASKIASQIDPNRVWNNNSMWSKIALVAGSSLLGRAGSDAGLKTMENMVANDIKAQIDDRDKGIIKHGNLVDLASKAGVAQTELTKYTGELAKEVIKGYGEAVKAGAKGADAANLAMVQAYEKMFPIFSDAATKQQSANLGVAALQQKASDDDVKNNLKAQENAIANMRLKFDKMEIAGTDKPIMAAVGDMSQAAREMENLENRKDFNPTTIAYAMKQVMADKGIPGGLTRDESAYMSAYARYFSALRQQMTGAAASAIEEKRIQNIILATKANRKDAVLDFQKRRGDIIGTRISTLNPQSRMIIGAEVPESRKYFPKSR